MAVGLDRDQRQRQRPRIVAASDLRREWPFGSTHTITFAIPSGPQAINLLSPLPASTVPLVVQLDATQNVTVVSPPGIGQNNFVALTKIGAGTITVSGAYNLTGTLQVDAGSLQLNPAGNPLNSSQPFGPVQGVDGEPLTELWPNGGMVANGNTFARGPVLFTTHAGTVLALTRYQANSQDASGDNNIFVRRSTDNGKTFGARVDHFSTAASGRCRAVG